MKLLSAILALVCVSGAVHAAPKSGRRAITLPRAPGAAALPFSDAVVVGDTLYLAGRIGIDPKTGNAPAEVDEEIKLLLDGVDGVLRAGGLTYDDLVYVQVFCTDLTLYAKFNDAYKARFTKDFPARGFMGIA